MGKHNQVEVGNWYNTEKYFNLQPGDDDAQRYAFAGSKVSCSLNFIPKEKNIPSQHQHPHEQILIVPIGDGEAVVDGKHYPTEPGFFAVIPPNLPHGYDVSKATRMCWNLDIFTPARYEYLKDNYLELLAQGKNPMEVHITED